MELAVWDPFADFNNGGTPNRVYQRHLHQLQVAEQLGFDHYYLIEHQNTRGRRGCGSASVMLAAMAMRTTSIRIGAMIWQLPFHNPLRLAQDIATLDHLSNGRLEFGAGIGTQEHEFVRWGVDYHSRQEMGEESLEILKLAWTEDYLTYSGKFWNYERAVPFPQPFQKPYPFIWAGCHSKRSHEWAARNSYGCAQNLDNGEDVAEKFALYRRIWAETHGADEPCKTWLMRPVYVDDTMERAHAIARPCVESMYGRDDKGRDPHAVNAADLGLDTSGYGGEANEDIRARQYTRKMMAGPNGYEWSLEHGTAIVGTPETVARDIIKQSEACGGLDVFCLSFEFGGLNVELADRSFERFGRFVIPLLHQYRLQQQAAALAASL